ncbi:MAG: hypothetical protein QME74_11090 [Candidatus Edwardsbacteria bacterium]|nr:hypothetical protein [Candidatus Edwardsbacteria bacterium]
MAKQFYTERDIEDLAKRGVTTLAVGDDVVLTELAYEKAGRLGVKLEKDSPVEPPGAPVRPYISQVQKPDTAACTGTAHPPAASTTDLPARIRDAVTAKLGAPIDPALLDLIIQRVLKSTGVK